MSKRKTVWILGSGFSRPLGGPTLAELFTEASQRFCKYMFSSDYSAACDASTSAAINLYRSPKEFCHWTDAEDYLCKLDNAVSGAAPQWNGLLSRILRDDLNITNFDLPAVAIAARRALAAECSAFLIDNPVTSESWIPYKHWVSQLDKNDTIITFNYDQVLEKLKGDLHVVLPAADAGKALALSLALVGVAMFTK